MKTSDVSLSPGLKGWMFWLFLPPLSSSSWEPCSSWRRGVYAPVKDKTCNELNKIRFLFCLQHSEPRLCLCLSFLSLHLFVSLSLSLSIKISIIFLAWLSATTELIFPKQYTKYSQLFLSFVFVFPPITNLTTLLCSTRGACFPAVSAPLWHRTVWGNAIIGPREGLVAFTTGVSTDYPMFWV